MIECKAKLSEVVNDLLTNNLKITFTTSDRNILNVINDLTDKDLILKASKWHNKRSLDSNAYLWVLLSKMAYKLNTTKEELYEDMLQKYGTVEETENGYVVISLKSEIDVSMLQGHWKFYKTSSDGRFKSYIMLKGSSDFDTLEMSTFLNMVVEEAKEIGVEVISEEELRQMNERWGT